MIISIATLHTSHLIGASSAVPEALTDGFRLGYLIGAGLVGIAALLTFTLLPRPHAAPEVRPAVWR